MSEAILHYMVPWQDLDWPVRWDRVFERSDPMEVEIGFGNGGFLADRAEQRPEAVFVGIERSWESVQRLFKRLERAGRSNVRIIQGDAAFLLEHLFAPDSIERLYINFPDPWPKERHHGRRLIQPAFVRTVAERLAPGGNLTVATDHAGYADWIAGVLENQSLLQSCFDSTRVHSLPGRRPTRYERKAGTAGVPIHYFLWRREARLPRSVNLENVEPMPNVILKGPCDRARLLADLEPHSLQTVRRGVNVVVKLMGVYADVQGAHQMVEVMVKEGEFSQHFGVLVLPRSDERLLVKLSPIGHPRPTWGVKQAVRQVAEAVLARYPDLRVDTSTVEQEMEKER